MKTEEILATLKPVADAIGVAVSELWKIFTRQYLVKGIAQLFSGIVFSAVTYYLGKYLLVISLNYLFLVIPLVIWSVLFFYSAIPLVFNPAYYAIEDILKKLKGVKNDSSNSY